MSISSSEKSQDICDLDFLTVDYSFAARVWNEAYEDEALFVTTILGSVHCFDDAGEKVDVGTVRWLTVNGWDALNTERSIVRGLDEASETEIYIDLIDINSETLLDSLVESFELDSDIPALLIGDRIYLKPEFRGKGIVERLIVDASRRHHDMQIIVIKPFPLQHEDTKRGVDFPDSIVGNEFSKNRLIAHRKLVQHYQQMGFTEIKGTELMATRNRNYY